MLDLLVTGATAAVAGGAALWSYLKSRHYVRQRLRFVDAVQKPVVPIVVGAATVLLAAPVVAILPFFGAGTAIVLGLGVGAGVAHGARDVRSLPE